MIRQKQKKEVSGEGSDCPLGQSGLVGSAKAKFVRIGYSRGRKLADSMELIAEDDIIGLSAIAAGFGDQISAMGAIGGHTMAYG